MRGQRISDVLRQTTNEHFNEQLKLLFRWLEDSTNTVDHGSYDDLEGFPKADIPEFIREKVEDLPQRTVILITPLFHGDHQISGKHDGDMGCQRIICEAVAFTDQVEIRLAGLEKHFDLPPFPIDPDDLFLGEFRICTVYR